MKPQSGTADRADALVARETIELLEARTRLSAAGSLDASFGSGGLVVDPLGTSSQFEHVIPLAGNKVLAAVGAAV